MAERPIILFGNPGTAHRTNRGPAIPNIKLPSYSRQSARLAPKMTALQSTLITLQQTAVGIEPEKALVFELAKDIQAFYMGLFKLKTNIDIDVYSKIAEKIRPCIQIQPIAEERGEE